jgi:Glycosyltransferase family 87
MPRNATTLPFLYPPPTLLLFAVLARLPLHLGGILFVGASIAAVLLAARRLGLAAPWSLLVLAWPPVFDGIMSGNVSVPLFAMFVLAPWVGSGLVVAPLFKPYTAVAALWLLREHRIRAALIGCAVVAGLCILTLPLVGGPGAWLDWIGGLRAFAQSEANIPALYGVGLGRYAPFAIVLVVGVAVIICAIRVRGVEGLGRLGVATIVLQASVYSHGFIVSLPALLSLRSRWFWVATAALSITISTGPSLGSAIGWPGTWIAIVLVVASWAVPSLRRGASTLDDPYHPLGRVALPWPGAPAIAGPTSAPSAQAIGSGATAG